MTAATTNIILSFPNRTNEATLTGGAWTVGLPLDNLKNKLLSKVARSNSADKDDTKFTADLGKPYPVRVIGLINHNLSLTAKWRIRGYDTESPATLVYDSGWLDAWLLTIAEWNIDALDWELDGYWYGGYAADELSGLAFNAFHVVPSVEKIAQVWTIEIDDESDNEDDYVQVGRLFIGPGRQTEVNYIYGAGLGYETQTAVDSSLSGVEFFETREGLRSFAFEFDALTETEGYGFALELTRRAGIHDEVAIIPDPSDEPNSLRRWFLGRLSKLNQLRQAYHRTMAMAFEVKERR